MIVETILAFIYNLFSAVLSSIYVPSLPGFNDVVVLVGDLLNQAQHFIDLVIPWDVVTTGLPILIIIIGFEEIYAVVMWVLRKIPMLGIE